MLNYVVEIWAKRLIFPRRPYVEIPARIHAQDSALVTASACGLAALVAAGAYATGQNVALALFFSLVVPLAEFAAIIGFLVYLHHTSPSIRWYDDEAEWKTGSSQINAVQHVLFPGVLGVLFQNIMEHHAHHVDPSISLHQLRPAQAALEAALGANVRVLRWTPKLFAQASRACKLYDYDAHRWCDFDGRPTTEPI